PRVVAGLVGGELRGRARGRRSLEEARRDVGEDQEERAPSRISRRDRRSRPAVPELGEIDDTLTGGGRVIEGRTKGYSPFAPTNRLDRDRHETRLKRPREKSSRTRVR